MPFSFVKTRRSWPSLLGLGLCALAMPVAAQYQVPEMAPQPTAPVAKPAPRPASPSPEDKAKTQALQQQVSRAEKEIAQAKEAQAKAEYNKQQLADELAKARAALRKPSSSTAQPVSRPTQTASPATVQLNGFTLLPGGTARDNKTSLEWMRCSLGQTWDGNTCQGKVKEFTFQEARQAAKYFNVQGGFAGKAKWRVPTAPELFGLVVCSKGIGTYTRTVDSQTLTNGCLSENYARPTIEQRIFPNTPSSQFLSSSPYVGDTYTGWFVDFEHGVVNGNLRDYGFPVRLVRTGE